VRVIAGVLGGRRLVAPPGVRTRPTSELVRGAIFNSLSARGVLEDAVVVDLFAGSGALGIEALSRGAKEVVFVESDRGAVATITKNLDNLGVSAVIANTTVERWVRGRHAATDIALADPPYHWDGWPDLLRALATFPTALIVAEAESELADPGCEVVGVSHHGDTVVTLLRPRGAPAS
jgi:16S rRNA (guanine966-N2)-methyltransferase